LTRGGYTVKCDTHEYANSHWQLISSPLLEPFAKTYVTSDLALFCRSRVQTTGCREQQARAGNMVSKHVFKLYYQVGNNPLSYCFDIWTV